MPLLRDELCPFKLQSPTTSPSHKLFLWSIWPHQGGRQRHHPCSVKWMHARSEPTKGVGRGVSRRISKFQMVIPVSSLTEVSIKSHSPVVDAPTLFFWLEISSGEDSWKGEKEWKRGNTGLREQHLRDFSTASESELLSLWRGSCLVTLRQMQTHYGCIETRASRRWGPTDISWSLLNTEKATATMLLSRRVKGGIGRSSSCSGTVHTIHGWAGMQTYLC